jgi:hypothetical protein
MPEPTPIRPSAIWSFFLVALGMLLVFAGLSALMLAIFPGGGR